MLLGRVEQSDNKCYWGGWSRVTISAIAEGGAE